MIAALVLLCVAAEVQETVLLTGHAVLGIWLVLPALLAVAALWRPGPEAVACILLALGLEALLTLHTGGTRYSDWLLHYELARHYGGLANSATPALIPGRTPLFQLLSGAVLAHAPGFGVFQLVSVLLNSLWLWPAGLLLERAGSASRPGRLLVMAVGPFVLAYSVYTWPWGLCVFFLLVAVVLAIDDEWVSAGGAGAALAGALLVHPGALGYVVGLAVFIALWRRHLVATLVGGIAIAATAIPWVLSVSGGDIGRMVRASVPARQAVGPALWLVTRAITAAASFFPIEPMGPDRPAVNWVIAFFFLTVPGALALTLLPLRRARRAPGPAVAAVIGGVLVGILIYPPNNAFGGMLDALYPAMILVLVVTLAEAGDGALAWPGWLNLAAGLVFAGCLLWVSNAPAPGDANLQLKTTFGLHFIADQLGLLPGVVLLLLAAGLAYVALSKASGGTDLRSTAPPRAIADVTSYIAVPPDE
ncbi:MAG TPA: hypothetical protein VGR61_11935 [Candidatus Dormibacteraeota bacterium]|nr:hypothetical protein [Candidatus Dormibacteraeota bacterium]